jgi:hypothetical protein
MKEFCGKILKDGGGKKYEVRGLVSLENQPFPFVKNFDRKTLSGFTPHLDATSSL